MVTETISRDYKLDQHDTEKHSDNKAFRITQSMQFISRMKSMPEKNAYILLKGHKVNFTNRPQRRLINPSEIEIWRILMQIIESAKGRIK